MMTVLEALVVQLRGHSGGESLQLYLEAGDVLKRARNEIDVLRAKQNIYPKVRWVPCHHPNSRAIPIDGNGKARECLVCGDHW